MTGACRPYYLGGSATLLHSGAGLGREPAGDTTKKWIFGYTCHLFVRAAGAGAAPTVAC
jgi:hypothetical protein